MDLASTSALDGLILPVLPGWLALGISLFFLLVGVKNGDGFFLIAGVVMLAFAL